MRLEVLVDQQEPMIFPLNKEKIIIGSGEHSDILLDADGISRKHVIIHCHEDEFYIIDQGSTNGTFINEERLVPGKRVEFTSFFPVRLGANVLLTLLSDDEAEDFELSDFNLRPKNELDEREATRVIRPSDLREQSSLSINIHRKKASVKSRHKAKGQGEKKVKKKKNPDSSFHNVVMLAVAIIIGTILYQMNTPDEVVTSEVTLAQPGVVEQPAVEDNAPAAPVIEKVSDEFIKSKDEVLRILADFKCASRLEKELCDALSLTPPDGVTQVGRDLFIFSQVEITEETFKAELERLSPDTQGIFPPEINFAYFYSHNPLRFSDEFNDYRIHLYFLNNERQLISGLSFYPSVYNEFRKMVSSKLWNDVLFGGPVIMDFSKDYFTYHKF